MDITAGFVDKGGLALAGQTIRASSRRVRSIVAGVGALALPLVCSGQAVAGALSSPGCLDGGDAAQVASIGPGLDVVLADGRDVMLPGIDPAREDRDAVLAADARSSLTQWLAGRAVAVHPLATAPDRWGRTAALVFATGKDTGAAASAGPGRVSIAEAMIEAGFARARPDPRIASCWTTFLAAESSARAAGAGLWAQPSYAVIPAGARDRLRASLGGMAIVEGRVARVGEGRTRIYLSLGNGGRSAFAIAVERRVAERLKATGVDPAAWTGRHLRVRGYLDDRFGMQVELTSMDQIEFTEPR